MPLEQMEAPAPLEAQRLDQLERRIRLGEELRLEQALLEFRLLLGVGNDAAADSHLTALSAQHDGADRHVELGIACWRDMANGAGVDRTRSTLEFADDLHRADLRRPRD